MSSSEQRFRPAYQVLKTGEHILPVAPAFGDVNRDELAAALGPDLVADGMVGATYMCVLLDTNEGLVLIDSGLPAEEQDDRPPLLPGLDALGVSPLEISLVILSHAHADHLGGLIRGGAPVFENARHVLAEAEWQYWMDGNEPRGLDPQMYEGLKEAARTYLSPVREAGLLDLVTGETRLRPGITLLPSPGHTPGHLSVEVTTNAEVLLYLGDAILHEAMVAHPTWTGLVDTDAEATVRTRGELLSRAAESAAIVAGGHLRGTGRVTRGEHGYFWTAAS